jgi:hypothetical protein
MSEKSAFSGLLTTIRLADIFDFPRKSFRCFHFSQMPVDVVRRIFETNVFSSLAIIAKWRA